MCVWVSISVSQLKNNYYLLWQIFAACAQLKWGVQCTRCVAEGTFHFHYSHTSTHTQTHRDAYARTWLTHLGPSHKPVQDIAEILLRCIWKWNATLRCDTCLPFVLLLAVHKDSRISLCLLANKQHIRETARLCLYSINVCLFGFAGSPCNMFSIEQRHIRIWSSDLFPVSTFLCVVFQPYLPGSRGSKAATCFDVSLSLSLSLSH